MEDEKQPSQCSRCGATSEQRVLISAEYKGEQTWVCVTCLPYLLHGG